MAQVSSTEAKVFLRPQKPTQSLHKSIKLIIIVANCFGLLPVDGVTSNSVEDLKFRWISLKTIYSSLVLLLAFCGTALHLASLFIDGFSATALFMCFGYFNWLMALAAYFYLATKWPKFMKKWLEVDLAMQRAYNYPYSLNARLKVTVVAIFVATVGYIVAFLPNEERLVSFFASKNTSAINGTQYIHTELLKALLQFNCIMIVLTWAFNDAFVVVISTALALRFQQINNRLLIHGANIKSLNFWSEIRTDYIRLFKLCQQINKYMPFQISLSFACNGWFVLLDLFFIVRYSNTSFSGGITVLYFDLFWCAFSIIGISLYTAWVNDESRKFAAILNSLPSQNYNLAIELLLEQIPFNPVALSGNNIFHCTRGLILNILGAVITYELLLIQFSDAVVSR